MKATFLMFGLSGLFLGLFLLAAPAAAQCGCYDGYGNASAWGGQGALPVIPEYGYYGGGPVVIDPYPAISAYGYRNSYFESDDETYGLRPPLVRRFGGHRYEWVRVR